MRTFTLLSLAAFALVAGCGGDDGGSGAEPAAAKPVAAKAAAATVERLAFPLKPSHASGVTGRAVLVQKGENLTVRLKLDKKTGQTNLAHIHTGPCSKEPTWTNPRIWVGLTDVVHSRSVSVVQLATIKDLRAEAASINVHDPDHNNRPLACGDVPRAP